MSPAVLAAIHAASFDAPWDVAAFADLLAQPGVRALGDQDGFILVREVAGEAEILTLAVRPQARRHGYGTRLIAAAVQALRNLGTERLFLEVADDNTAALALYETTGFSEVGRRRGYYVRPGGPAVDARLMEIKLSDPLP